MRIGWIGLGAMGAPMALRLAEAGHTVLGFDVSPSRRSAVAGRLRIVDSVADAARGAEVLFIMVATAQQAHDALTDATSRLSPGSAVVVTATIGPQAMEELAVDIRAAGSLPVDAPVSGGTVRAATGDLLAMVGAEDSALALVRPVLNVLADRLVVIGPTPGDGQRMKLVNQLLCGVHIVVAAEALGFADSLGINVRRAWETLRRGAAQSFMLDDRGERMVAQDFGDVRSATEIFTKDMALVLAAARDHGFRAPLAEQSAQIFQQASDAGLAREDDSSIVTVYMARHEQMPPSAAGTSTVAPT